MNELRLLKRDLRAAGSAPAYPPLGEVLLSSGKIDRRTLSHALRLQRRIDAPLGDIMVSEGLVSQDDVLGALAVQAGSSGAGLLRDPPAPEMATHLSPHTCLKHGVVPWKDEPEGLLVATSSPAGFAALRAELGPTAKPLVPVIVTEAQVQSQISRLHGRELAHLAARRVPAQESCRGWDRLSGLRARCAAAVAVLVGVAALAEPALTVSALAMLATVLLFLTTLLKLAALLAHVTRHLPPLRPRLAALRRRFFLARTRQRWRPAAPQAQEALPELQLLPMERAMASLRIAETARGFAAARLPTINAGDAFRLPRVSVLVPLLREREIAGQLIDRLSRLTYPKSLLEVVLVLEDSDTLTRETLARTALPDWMRVIEVPDSGELTTKPRALNYALEFCKGSIIGVWDAEDWPEADQIERVVTRFHRAPRETACLQGKLDYYNSRTNWLTHCFTIEYATWWRVFLPGIARLGLVVPLGGTTLFFRRTVLESLGGWDAHNVTEDADLGLRLARHGYRTELIDTVTREEATSRAWPWVRQRSRWLKGFLMTYCVHMRDVPALWRDLGPARFLGVQALFLAAVLQFALAPVLWSFWLILAGLGHPAVEVLGPATVWAMIGLFVFAELLTFGAGLIAVARRSRWHLIPFLPTMGIYFTLGTLAAYKAIWEMLRAPFFWDKTQHGVSHQTDYKP